MPCEALADDTHFASVSIAALEATREKYPHIESQIDAARGRGTIKNVLA